ncbi:MAG: Hsp33 family molecular chaperone [Phenylobacterium sp.]|uniref:Hsp33 family molecular chaperone n=1 Tax=Phenylobacterium sp. TaxID=1871053 RepID=UPI0027272589|nr:Hsp33 family molecular chaperone [Phenylobacterium sp.]MDO8913401.1 Hsp33 family molecular chaperone [Phenylobacterium sp.]MDO9245432.1 Hsp33 family molecular chaperone [Phenylobacterium sp.]MDP3101247.1 Hsp33 family molecular chaperone [Phenylobacterium sp.]MDP3867782.1 Hsp33 family molecular chaperone [Phenylobacterium sp.]
MSIDTTAAPDDLVAPFQIEGEPVRGRLARLGAAVDEILAAHDYPEAVANLLGEACALAALVGSNLKFDGRLIVQAQGDGPVRYVVVDYDTDGALRGYCRYDPDAVAKAAQGFVRPGAKTLLGEGVFIMTVDQGADMDRYQGITTIEGETLALCAEQYFAQSEQTPTRVRLAVGQADLGDGLRWRAGGMLIQNIAEDENRGPTAEAWVRTQAFFETIGEDELIDPTISAETLLFRLFHEDGVRVFEAKPLKAFCRCSQDRIESVLTSFSPEERAEMVEDDGLIKVTCEYCSSTYSVDPADLKAEA